MNKEIAAYNNSQSSTDKIICQDLAQGDAVAAAYLDRSDV